MLHSSQYIRLSHNSRNFRHIQHDPAMEYCLDERYRRLSAHTKPIYKYKFHKRQILTFFDHYAIFSSFVWIGSRSRGVAGPAYEAPQRGW